MAWRCGVGADSRAHRAAARLAAQPACGRLDPRSRLAFDHRRDGVQPIEPSLEASTTLGMGASEAVARIGLITLDIGSGNYAEACALARQLIDMDVIHIHSRLLPELVESALRSGDRILAETALHSLSAKASASQ